LLGRLGRLGQIYNLSKVKVTSIPLDPPQMSASKEWVSRLESHRYSQDDRGLAQRFQAAQTELVNKFLADHTEQTLVLGSFNLEKEAWRLLTLHYFRGLNVKIIQQQDPDHPELTRIILRKQKLSSVNLGK